MTMFRVRYFLCQHRTPSPPRPSQPQPQPLPSPTTILIVLILIAASSISSIHSTSTTDNISDRTFAVHYDKDKPADMSACFTSGQQARRAVLCIHFCARNISCEAVFVEFDTQSNMFECYLCHVVWSVSSLHTGTGVYAVPKFNGRGVLPPHITGVTLVKVDDHMGKTAAFYNCPNGEKARNFELAFDEQTDTWPTLSEGCQQSLCDTESVDGVLMSMSQPSPGVFRLSPNCQPDERPNGFLECWDNSWTEPDDLGRICIPRTCTSTNSRGRMVYQGQLNTTRSGIPCQRWSSMSPNIHVYNFAHFFLEDYGSVSGAGNMCRDPANNGYLWCYKNVLSIKRWDKCDVPSCP